MQKRTDFFDNSLLSIVPDIPLVIRNKPHNNQLCTDLFRFISAYPVVSHFLRFAWQTTDAGFDYKIYDTDKNTARLDMIKCPYHIMTVRYGCPELCVCFCDSDDIAYGDIHPKLKWHRSKTLGRGNDCCDFSLSYIKSE